MQSYENEINQDKKYNKNRPNSSPSKKKIVEIKFNSKKFVNIPKNNKRKINKEISIPSDKNSFVTKNNSL